MSHHRKGETKPQKTGRAARTRIGVTTVRAHRAAVLGALIARINAGKVLARDYLVKLDLDADFITRYESAFGRVVAKVYRQTTGQDPKRDAVTLVRGWLRKTYAYSADDMAILDIAAHTYPRTRALVGA